MTPGFPKGTNPAAGLQGTGATSPLGLLTALSGLMNLETKILVRNPNFLLLVALQEIFHVDWNDVRVLFIVEVIAEACNTVCAPVGETSENGC